VSLASHDGDCPGGSSRPACGVGAMSCARRLAVASLWLWGALLCVSYAPAQAPRETRDTLEFRRVYVPIERLGELSSGHPVKRDEFEQLLATINAVPHGPRGASARVVSAEYSAR